MTALIDGLRVSGLGMRFRRRRALDDITFQIETRRLGLVGNNGSGKSTLLDVFSGASRASEGRFEFLSGGEPVREPRIGYLPQHFDFDRWSRVDDFVLYSAWLAALPRRQRMPAAEASLRRTGLWADRRTRLGQLSGGMLRRAGIAAIVVTEPQVLILDEPTAGLDSRQRRAVREIVAVESSARMTIITSHLFDDILATSDVAIVLGRGRVERIGSPHALQHEIPQLLEGRGD